MMPPAEPRETQRVQAVLTLYDITDPRQAGERSCLRTVMDQKGNRYVLLATAQYLQLLSRALTAELQVAGTPDPDGQAGEDSHGMA